MMVPNFLVDHKTVHQRIAGINPVAYKRTRNYLNAVLSAPLMLRIPF